MADEKELVVIDDEDSIPKEALEMLSDNEGGVEGDE